MKINQYDDVFPYVIIEDTYNEKELNLIWQELDFLCSSKSFLPPENPELETASLSGEILKKNKSLWLDTFYSNRNSSNILELNRIIFTHYPKIFQNHPSWIFKNFDCNKDTTLISYYESGGYYKKHKDNSFFTSLTWFFREPKKFSGGDLQIEFGDNILEFEIKNNQTLIFPSIIPHEVTEVKMNTKDLNKKLGRFCMTQFLTLD